MKENSVGLCVVGFGVWGSGILKITVFNNSIITFLGKLEKMSCDGYTSSALMGNWFEEKQSFKQPSKLQPESRHVCPRTRPIYSNQNFS
jgi:hypothetical protein